MKWITQNSMIKNFWLPSLPIKNIGTSYVDSPSLSLTMTAADLPSVINLSLGRTELLLLEGLMHCILLYFQEENSKSRGKEV